MEREQTLDSKQSPITTWQHASAQQDAQQGDKLTGLGANAPVSGELPLIHVMTVCKYSGHLMGRMDVLEDSLPPFYAVADELYTFGISPAWTLRDPRLALSWLREHDKIGYCTYLLQSMCGPIFEPASQRITSDFDPSVTLLGISYQAETLRYLNTSLDALFRADAMRAETLLQALERLSSLFEPAEIRQYLPTKLIAQLPRAFRKGEIPLAQFGPKVIDELFSSQFLHWICQSAIPETCKVMAESLKTRRAAAHSFEEVADRIARSEVRPITIARSYVYGKDGKPTKRSASDVRSQRSESLAKAQAKDFGQFLDSMLDAGPIEVAPKSESAGRVVKAAPVGLQEMNQLTIAELAQRLADNKTVAEIQQKPATGAMASFFKRKGV